MPVIGFHSVIDSPEFGQPGDAADDDHRDDQRRDHQQPARDGTGPRGREKAALGWSMTAS